MAACGVCGGGAAFMAFFAMVAEAGKRKGDAGPPAREQRHRSVLCVGCGQEPALVTLARDLVTDTDFLDSALSRLRRRHVPGASRRVAAS